MYNNDNSAQYFLDLIKKSRRGKFKIYIGMIAGVGKTYRMLQDARSMVKNGIDVKIGYVENSPASRNCRISRRATHYSQAKEFL